MLREKIRTISGTAWSVAVVSSWGSSGCQKMLKWIRWRLPLKMGFSLSPFPRKMSRSLMLKLFKSLVKLELRNLKLCYSAKRSMACLVTLLYICWKSELVCLVVSDVHVLNFKCFNYRIRSYLNTFMHCE